MCFFTDVYVFYVYSYALCAYMYAYLCVFMSKCAFLVYFYAFVFGHDRFPCVNTGFVFCLIYKLFIWWAFGAKCYRQNDCSDHVIISGVS